ncbi:MAG: adenosylcobinamide-GDP ribazoletransferase [Synergistaceae bacterium]|nr:adenosylcobinamide-GDP ribazoletransferase [Synergistaceae bacterium]
MKNSLLIAISFITIAPVPVKLLPDWTRDNLRHFCPMLPVAGIVFFAPLWALSWLGLRELGTLSPILRGLFMTLITLALTGGLHMDGLLDTCDAVFSHRDRETRLKILDDPHSGAFAVIGCVSALMLKTLLFAEIFSCASVGALHVALIPVSSRLGMGMLLACMNFAKSGGLAVILGESRSQGSRYLLIIIFIAVTLCDFVTGIIIALISLLWCKICSKIFGGITGDLLGAFVELSEIVLLAGQVISNCT